MSQISTAPGSLRRVRPPTSDSAPSPGAVGPLPFPVLRPTARLRPHIVPRALAGTVPPPVFAVTDPYVRRFWTAALGPGAVADLLRLATAARRGRSLPRPVHLADLVTAGLAATQGGCVLVRLAVPPLPDPLLRRLPPRLQREHRELIGRR